MTNRSAEIRWPDDPQHLPPEKIAELLYIAQLEHVREERSGAQAADNAEALAAAEAGHVAKQASVDAKTAKAQAKRDAIHASEQAAKEADAAKSKATMDASYASIAAFHDALIDVSKGSIERARTGAETVQKAAAAIATLYTGVLALAFSVAERPLPSRGLVPAILLGWAIVWATAYLAYISKSGGVDRPKPTSAFADGAMRRSEAFIRWAQSGALNRAYALRVSVVSLAFALALLPAPFVVLGKASPPSGPGASAPDWPTTPSSVADPELQKILFQAQVDEATAARETARKPVAEDGKDKTWFAIGGGAVALSLIVPLLIPAGSGQQAPPGRRGDRDGAVC